MKIQLTQLECKRCGYIWIPRTINKPKVCPKCKHYKWNEEKNNESN